MAWVRGDKKGDSVGGPGVWWRGWGEGGVQAIPDVAGL
jgi:hypothetical protein